MSQPNQPRKRKSSKKVKSANTKNPTPLTLKEIAFINRTAPPAKEEKEPDALSEKLFHQLLESFVKQFKEFLESYGGFYTRSALMDMFGISSKNTFNTWMKEKGLPFYQIDTKVVIKKSDLEEFLKRYRKIMPFFIISFSQLADMGMMLMAA